MKHVYVLVFLISIVLLHPGSLLSKAALLNGEDNNSGKLLIEQDSDQAEFSESEKISEENTFRSLPPGWNFLPTGSSHIVAITGNTLLDCLNLVHGDYIGVFYTDDNGDLVCGGAITWDENQNQVLTAFGDDITTPGIKDGFAEDEVFTWKVYYNQAAEEQIVFAAYDLQMPNHDGTYKTNGVSALLSLSDPFEIFADADPEAACSGETVQLSVEITGGCEPNSFEWSSEPAGFSSTIQNPAANPSTTTSYFVTVSNQYGDVQYDTVVVEVYPLPQIDCPESMEACEDGLPVLLDTALPAGGIYSGIGVYFEDENYYFDPTMGAGTYEITYCYTNPDTGCENCCIFDFIVNPLPEVTCPDAFVVCSDTEPFDLSGGMPEGGNYSGSGVIDGKFYPEIAGPGTNEITYVYTDPVTGCSNSCSFIIGVVEVSIECPGDMDVCIGDEPFMVSGGTPSGGTYSGPGVNNGLFSPEDAGPGLHTISYTWQYAGTNCSATCTFLIQVHDAPQLDCPEDIEVCLNAPGLHLEFAFPPGGTYSGNYVFFEDGEYFFDPTNGLGTSVITYCFTDPDTGCQACCEFIISVVADLVIDLPAGWSGISSFIVPENPVLDNLLYPITYPLIILSNFDGVYWPGGNTFTLDTWDEYSGYVTKVDWDTQLPLCGDEVQSKIVNLDQGWNLIPMLSQEPIDSEAIFGDVSEIQIVKDVAGTGIFWPQFQINTLGPLMPGKAYYLRMSAPGSIDFSAITKSPTTNSTSDNKSLQTPWNSVVSTPGSHLVAFNLADSPFKTGDIIGAFTQQGLCAGLVEVTDVTNPFALSVNADDTYETSVTGFLVDETLNFKLFRPSTGEEIMLETDFDSRFNTGSFEHNGLSVVSKAVQASTGIMISGAGQLHIYPNPTNGILHIESSKTPLSITVYDGFGSKVLTNDILQTGRIDLSNHSRGVYVIKIDTGSNVFYRKVVLN